MKKLRLREVKPLAQGHTAGKQQTWVPTQCSLGSFAPLPRLEGGLGGGCVGAADSRAPSTAHRKQVKRDSTAGSRSLGPAGG